MQRPTNRTVVSKSITTGTNLTSVPHVALTLTKCSDLPSTGISVGVKSYAIISIGSEVVESFLLPRTNNPLIGQKFLIAVPEGSLKLIIALYDRHLIMSDELVGYTALNLYDLPQGKTLSKNLKLAKTKGASVHFKITAHNFGLSLVDYYCKNQDDEDAEMEESTVSIEDIRAAKEMAKKKVSSPSTSDSITSNTSSDVDLLLDPAVLEAIADVGEKVTKKNPQWDEKIGKEEGLWIYRIEDYNIVPVPKEQIGKFYSSHCYIVIRTYKSNRLKTDVHMWTGSNASRDDTACVFYKSNLLDQILQPNPNIHREEQSNESPLFLSYFSHPIIIMDGHVNMDRKVAHLLQVKGKGIVRVKEVECSGDSLNEGDVFILVKGDNDDDNLIHLFLWIGKDSRKTEISIGEATVDYLQKVYASEQKQVKTYSLKQEGSEAFWSALGTKKPNSIKSAKEGGDDDESEKILIQGFKLFKVSEHKGKTHLNLMCTGKIHQSSLYPNSIHLIDVGNRVFVWVGKEAQQHWKDNCLLMAQKYLIENEREYLPITRVLQDYETTFFKQFLF